MNLTSNESTLMLMMDDERSQILIQTENAIPLMMNSSDLVSWLCDASNFCSFAGEMDKMMIK